MPNKTIPFCVRSRLDFHGAFEDYLALSRDWVILGEILRNFQKPLHAWRPNENSLVLIKLMKMLCGYVIAIPIFILFLFIIETTK